MMVEVGDFVIVKTGILKGRIGQVTEKYYGNGSYLFNCYIVRDIRCGQHFEYYRKEFSKANKNRVLAELL